MRNKILSCLGNFPKKTELDFSLDETQMKPTYFQHKVSYNVETCERISAYLLVPKCIDKKMPAILAIHQHAGQWHIGKSEVVGLGGDKMYHYGLELVNRGYVVIAPDLLCFEERVIDEFNEDSQSRLMYERFEFTKRVTAGSCLQTKYLHDLSIAIDALETLDYVDKDRIGVIGHSLGGQETMWIMWYDQRLKAGISSCGFGTLKTITDNYVNHNFAAYIPGITNLCDNDEVVCQIAPRAFFMTNGSSDSLFPIDGVKHIIKTAHSQYKKLNAEDNFSSIIFNGGHSFGDEEKVIAYDWLSEKLSN